MLAKLAIEPGRCTVRFGPDGPERHLTWRRLRRATGREIVEAGLLGVGCTKDQARAALEYARQRKTAHEVGVALRRPRR